MAAAWVHSPVKRGIDVIVGSVALTLLSPVIAVTAVAVRIKLGARVLFRQERAGLDGTPFRVVKFRSMLDGDEPDEERLTSFGKAMRASSLDELPQLWNVVRGDMSLVGPRPLPTKYVPRYSAEQHRRLDARPGITGWAQVHGRNAVGWPERLALDVEYVDTASPLLDARIVWRTLRLVLARGGVSSDGHVTMHEFRGQEFTGDL